MAQGHQTRKVEHLPLVLANFKDSTAQLPLADLAEVLDLPSELSIQLLGALTCTRAGRTLGYKNRVKTSAPSRRPIKPMATRVRQDCLPLPSSRNDEEGPAPSRGDCLFLNSRDSGVSGVGVKDPSAVGGLLSLFPCEPAPIASRSRACVILSPQTCKGGKLLPSPAITRRHRQGGSLQLFAGDSYRLKTPCESSLVVQNTSRCTSLSSKGIHHSEH